MFGSMHEPQPLSAEDVARIHADSSDDSEFNAELDAADLTVGYVILTRYGGTRYAREPLDPRWWGLAEGEPDFDGDPTGPEVFPSLESAERGAESLRAETVNPHEWRFGIGKITFKGEV